MVFLQEEALQVVEQVQAVVADHVEALHVEAEMMIDVKFVNQYKKLKLVIRRAFFF